MNTLAAIGQKLQDLGLVDEPYQLSIGFMPPAPDTIVALYGYAGQPEQGNTGLQAPGLQVRVRTGQLDLEAAIVKIEAIMRSLSYIGRIDATDGTILDILPTQSGWTSIGPDENERPNLVTNFIVWRSR